MANKKSSDPRNTILKIRFNNAELEKLKERAPDGDRSISPWLRSLALDQQVQKKRTPKIDPELNSHLARIGTNINQIARYVNSRDKSGIDADMPELLRLMREMHESLGEIRQEFTK